MAKSSAPPKKPLKAPLGKAIAKPKARPPVLAKTPANRFGEAQELVGAALLLASDSAGSFINGLELIVDGGFCAMTI